MKNILNRGDLIVNVAEKEYTLDNDLNLIEHFNKKTDISILLEDFRLVSFDNMIEIEGNRIETLDDTDSEILQEQYQKNVIETTSALIKNADVFIDDQNYLRIIIDDILDEYDVDDILEKLDDNDFLQISYEQTIEDAHDIIEINKYI